MQLSQSDLERFWKKVDKTEDCWKWLASKNPPPYDYGQFKLGKVTRFAHRASYIIANGSIPKRMRIIHSCKNYWCVNPKHLQALDPVAHLNNVAGWKSGENAKKTHCPKGHPLVAGNLEKGMLKNYKTRQCLICLRAKTQGYNDPELKAKQIAWRQDPKVKSAKKLYDKERYLKKKELAENTETFEEEEFLIFEDDEIKGTKLDWLNEVKAYQSSNNHYKITETPQKIRIENRKQKKLIAQLEDYRCQLCGWSLEWTNSKGKISRRIDIDHIVEKKDKGGEEGSNLWALCPNCHTKKTMGVIKVDLINKRIIENGKEIRLLSDYHLRW